MIEPTEADIGRKVIYTGNRYLGGKPEEGVITSFNHHAVFVRYGSDHGSKATSRADLEWECATAIRGVNHIVALSGGKNVPAMHAVSDVRALCRERYGDTPCIAIKSGRGTLTETYDCTDWCPLLRRSIEEPCHQTEMPTQPS